MKIIVPNFSFAFFDFINCYNQYKQSYLGNNLLHLSKKDPETNLNVL